MNDYFVTFGKNHRHPKEPTIKLLPYWARVTAKDYESAKQAIIARFSLNGWSMLFIKDDFEKEPFEMGEYEHIIQEQ